MLRDNLAELIVPMQSSGTQALGDEFSYLENPRPIGTESSLTGRCSSPFQTEPRHYEREQSGERVASTGTSHRCDRRRWWSPVSDFVRGVRRNGCKALFLARHLR